MTHWTVRTRIIAAFATRFGEASAAAMPDKTLDANEVSTRLRPPDWYEVRIASGFNQPARKRE
ncbi:MAG: hypothetical protein H7247_12315 [Polaromonas sp.]|nr:hypothetical protein [Gemmatimonadaceae bacterium]